MDMPTIVRAEASAPAVVRRMTDAVIMSFSVAIMAPFLAAFTVYAGLALSARAIVRMPRALAHMADYAGTMGLGG